MKINSTIRAALRAIGCLLFAMTLPLFVMIVVTLDAGRGFEGIGFLLCLAAIGAGTVIVLVGAVVLIAWLRKK